MTRGVALRPGGPVASALAGRPVVPAVDDALRVLSVCSGVGGLDLGLRRAANARTVCYVEHDPYAVASLRTLFERGALDAAPVWDDLLSFDGRPWRGRVDLLAGGVPCQANSTAGKRLGRADPRHLWPAYFRVLREVRSPLALLENVPGLRTVEGGALFSEVQTDLAQAGYLVRWCGVRAGPPTREVRSSGALVPDVGAPHGRERVFLLAVDGDVVQLVRDRDRDRDGGEGGRRRGDRGGV